jgi:chemotaxis protein CheD
MLETGRFPTLRTGDIFLNPGEMHTGFAPARVWTILGSCVSIIVWHEKLRFGAMTHFLLPERMEPQSSAALGLDPRYGVDACKLLLVAMRRAGVRPELCQGHLFGGSHRLMREQTGIASVGQRNAAVAERFVKECGISVISKSLSGPGHRRIYFDLASGGVWESTVHSAEKQTVRKSRSLS